MEKQVSCFCRVFLFLPFLEKLSKTFNKEKQLNQERDRGTDWCQKKPDKLEENKKKQNDQKGKTFDKNVYIRHSWGD